MENSLVVSKPSEPKVFVQSTTKFGNFELSVQASGFHYCSPRVDLPRMEDYTSFEIAIFEGEEWVIPAFDERFKNESWAEEFDSYEGATTSVAGWQTRETIRKVVASLLRESGATLVNA